MSEPEILPRARREEIVSAHAALQVLKPLHKKMGDWHETAVKLAVLALSNRTDSEDRDRIRTEAASLSNEIKRDQARLESHLTTLPPNVQSNGRVVDTRKSLAVLLARVSDIW